MSTEEDAALAALIRPMQQQRQALLGHLSARFADLLVQADPNWRYAVIRIAQAPERGTEYDHLVNTVLMGGSYQGTPPFDATPTLAYVNGPKGGDAEVPLDQVLRRTTIRPLLVSLVQTVHLLPRQDPWAFVLQNPEHQLAPVPGVTRLKFRDGDWGFVLNTDPEGFVVAKGRSFDALTSLERYDRRRVTTEMAFPADAQKPGTVSGYIYLPRRYRKNGLPADPPSPAVDVQAGGRVRQLMARLGSKPRLDLGTGS